MNIEAKKLTDDFLFLYYNSPGTWVNPWLGVVINKTPLDLWIYQEIIVQQKPTVLIECGSHLGGSALYLASIMDLVGSGRVVSIDVADRIDAKARAHKRIQFIRGSSIDLSTVAQVKALIKPDDVVMVSLDSHHDYAHVLREMNLYGLLVTKGQYMVVEDGCIRHPVLPQFSPGPYEAIEEYFKTPNNFIIDKTKERFLMTFNPNGYLRRIS